MSSMVPPLRSTPPPPLRPGPWRRRLWSTNLHLLQARCKHLGTENNLKILQSIYETVKEGVEFRFRTAVTKMNALGTRDTA